MDSGGSRPSNVRKTLQRCKTTPSRLVNENCESFHRTSTAVPINSKQLRRQVSLDAPSSVRRPSKLPSRTASQRMYSLLEDFLFICWIWTFTHVLSKHYLLCFNLHKFWCKMSVWLKNPVLIVKEMMWLRPSVYKFWDENNFIIFSLLWLDWHIYF